MSFSRRRYHLILATRNSWLIGDERGFRTRDHRVHSSGDYQQSPPPAEQAGLREYHQKRSGQPVKIPVTLRPVVGQAIVGKAAQQQHQILALALAVAEMQTHVLANLPADRSQVKQIGGSWKQASSHAIRTRLPGKVWAAGGNPIPIKDDNHRRNTYNYNLAHEQQDAWIWKSPHLPTHPPSRS